MKEVVVLTLLLEHGIMPLSAFPLPRMKSGGGVMNLSGDRHG
jgi:hypothetical protein